MPYADVNGQHIHYEDTGGDGAPVIFMHGFMTDHELFEHQAAALGGEFRCISWDARGFGRTPLTGPFTFWDQTDDALALAEHLGAHQAFYAGMSMGGFVALRAALRAPERVLGIALIATLSGPEDQNLVPEMSAGFEDWAANGPSDEFMEKVAELLFPPGYDYAAWKSKWRDWPLESIPPLAASIFERDDITDRLGEITVPAIVLHGERDAGVKLEVAKRLCDGLANCEQFVAVPGAYHAVNLTHPDEINPPLAEFFRRHRP